jgi:hypothetical protein
VFQDEPNPYEPPRYTNHPVWQHLQKMHERDLWANGFFFGFLAGGAVVAILITWPVFV